MMDVKEQEIGELEVIFNFSKSFNVPFFLG